jgi:hypothetical protein
VGRLFMSLLGVALGHGSSNGAWLTTSMVRCGLSSPQVAFSAQSMLHWPGDIDIPDRADAECCMSLHRGEWLAHDDQRGSFIRLRKAGSKSASWVGLEPERVGFWHARLGMLRSEGRDGRCLIEPDIGIELLRQRSIGVVAQ